MTLLPCNIKILFELSESWFLWKTLQTPSSPNHTHTHSYGVCHKSATYIEQEHTQETDGQKREGSEDNQEGSLGEGQADVSDFYTVIIMLLSALTYSFSCCSLNYQSLTMSKLSLPLTVHYNLFIRT